MTFDKFSIDKISTNTYDNNSKDDYQSNPPPFAATFTKRIYMINYESSSFGSGPGGLGPGGFFLVKWITPLADP